MSRTLAIIKPDAVKRNIVGKIISRIESEGLTVVACKRKIITKKEAEGFYIEHAKRPFYGELTDFMSSNPSYVAVLEGANAQPRWREIMGATNPADADEGTIRKEFGISLDQNSVHGSDSEESANREISFFFSETEIN